MHGPVFWLLYPLGWWWEVLTGRPASGGIPHLCCQILIKNTYTHPISFSETCVQQFPLSSVFSASPFYSILPSAIINFFTIYFPKTNKTFILTSNYPLFAALSSNAPFTSNLLQKNCLYKLTSLFPSITCHSTLICLPISNPTILLFFSFLLTEVAKYFPVLIDLSVESVNPFLPFDFSFFLALSGCSSCLNYFLQLLFPPPLFVSGPIF